MNPWEINMQGGVRTAAQRALQAEARDLLREGNGRLSDIDN